MVGPGRAWRSGPFVPSPWWLPPLDWRSERKQKSSNSTTTTAVVEASGAPWPNADIILETDGTVREQAGFSMAMGYLNGDRFADLVVGAPGDEKVYIFYGGIDVGGPAETSEDAPCS